MAQTPQTYKSHARFFPLFHFFVAPVLLINLLNAIRHLYLLPVASPRMGAGRCGGPRRARARGTPDGAHRARPRHPPGDAGAYESGVAGGFVRALRSADAAAAGRVAIASDAELGELVRRFSKVSFRRRKRSSSASVNGRRIICGRRSYGRVKPR